MNNGAHELPPGMESMGRGPSIRGLNGRSVALPTFIEKSPDRGVLCFAQVHRCPRALLSGVHAVVSRAQATLLWFLETYRPGKLRCHLLHEHTARPRW